MLSVRNSAPRTWIAGLDHIGVVSKDPARTRWFFSAALQLSSYGEESVPSQLVDTVSWSSTHGRYEHVPLLELLVPSAPTSVVAKFLAQRGGGVHHLSFRVRGIERAVAELRDKGVQFVTDTPQQGINDTRVIFIHPHSTGGLLIELVEQAP